MCGSRRETKRLVSRLFPGRAEGSLLLSRLAAVRKLLLRKERLFGPAWLFARERRQQPLGRPVCYYLVLAARQRASFWSLISPASVCCRARGRQTPGFPGNALIGGAEDCRCFPVRTRVAFPV